MRAKIVTVLVLILTVSCQKSESLFQENQSDWDQGGNAHWSFSNGELIGKANDEVGFVMTKSTYKDFILELEFNPDDSINSGIFIRCKNFELSAEDCYEVNIWDLHPNQDFRTGSVVTRAKPLEIVETNNKWNTYKIKNVNDHLQIWINDILTIDMKDNSLVEGYIGLQASGTGSIGFRNVKISPIQ